MVNQWILLSNAKETGFKSAWYKWVNQKSVSDLKFLIYSLLSNSYDANILIYIFFWFSKTKKKYFLSRIVMKIG